MRGYRVFIAIGLSVMTVAVLSVGLANAQAEVCETLVQEVFGSLADKCAAAPGNSACFGRSASADSGTFAAPGDVLNLAEVQSIQTGPLDVANGEWGLALLNVHANVPRALSDQGLKFFLMGEARIENAVAAEAAFTPVEPLTIVPLVAANLRGTPSLNGVVIANAPVGTELLADGRTPDGQWVRVLKDQQTAWISRQIVTAPAGDIETLPAIGADTQTPMQSFILSTGPDSAECAAAPSALVIQSPGGILASILVNGVDIRFDQAVALRVIDGKLQVTALGGSTSVTRLPLPAGFAVEVPLSEDGRAAAGAASSGRPITDGERQRLTQVIGGLPAGLVYAPVSVPSAEQVAAVLANLNRPGAATTSTISGVDCAQFKPTSPLGGAALGVEPFYWDAARGATSYRLNIYNGQGSVVSSVDVSATSTTLSVDLSTMLDGSSVFSWNVDALLNGQIACSSSRVSTVTEARVELAGGGGGAPLPTPTACTWSC